MRNLLTITLLFFALVAIAQPSATTTTTVQAANGDSVGPITLAILKGWINSGIPSGSGTADYLTRWITSTTQGTGLSQDNGLSAGVGSIGINRFSITRGNYTMSFEPDAFGVGRGYMRTFNNVSTANVPLLFATTELSVGPTGQVSGTAMINSEGPVRVYNTSNFAAFSMGTNSAVSSGYTVDWGQDNTGVYQTNSSSGRGYYWGNANGTLASLSATGDFGIGVTAARKLDVNGLMRVRSTTGILPTRLGGLDASNGDFGLFSLASGLYYDGSKLTLGGSLVASDAMMDIYSTSTTFPNLMIGTAGGDLTADIGFYYKNGTPKPHYARIAMTATAGTPSAETGYLSILVRNAGTEGEVARFNPGGQVGIGTTSTARLLVVGGEMRVTDLTTDTPTRFVGADADGDFGQITLGTGFTLPSGVLTYTETGTGTVTSVAATAPAAGFTVSGSPITTSGTLTFSLANDLAGLEGLSGTGIPARTATDTWTTRTITAGTGISVADGGGVAGNPTITNTAPDQTVVITGASGTYPNFTVATGTVTNFSAGDLSPLFTTSEATTTTTPALTFNLSTQTANTVFSGPGSGSAAAPTFRALVPLDVPALDFSKITTGTVPIAQGGTNITSYTQGDILYSSATNVLSKLPKSASATRYLSNTGTSNDPAWAQVNLANGVTGNLPVTNLNSGTSASSATFWRGDGTWAGTGGPTGSGIADYSARWVTSSVLGTGVLRDDGTGIGVNAAPLSGFMAYFNGATRTDGAIVSKGNGSTTAATTNSSLRLWNDTGGSGDIWYISSENSGQFLVQGAPGTLFNADPDGTLGLYVTSPTARLHLPAGTSSAGTSPLKFSSGSVTSTAEHGAQEYRGTEWYMTKGATTPLRFALGGVIADFTDAANNVGTGETDLYSYTTPARTFENIGNKVTFETAGIFADLTATAVLKVYFAGTQIATTGTLTVSSLSPAWSMRTVLTQTASTTVRCIVDILTPGTSTPYHSFYTELTGLTLTGTNILKMTAQAGGASGGNNDISAKLGSMRWDGTARN